MEQSLFSLCIHFLNLLKTSALHGMDRNCSLSYRHYKTIKRIGHSQRQSFENFGRTII